jgi:hypothetical protein
MTMSFMKATFLLSVSLVLVCTSCEKEELAGFDEYWNQFQGDASALLNGVPANQNNHRLWVRGELYKANDWDSAMGSVFLVRANRAREKRESFGIGPFPLYRTGRYKINRVEIRNIDPSSKLLASTMSLSAADGDALVGFYYVVPTEDNYINITRFDREEIHGTFRITFAKSEPFRLGADTVRITDGVFRTKITLGTELR